MMKNYLIFLNLWYYPKGGMEDFIGDANSLSEAAELIKTYLDNLWEKDMEGLDKTKFNKEEFIAGFWWHIYNVKQKNIILKSK